MPPTTPTRDTRLDELVDEVARAIIPGLNAVADKAMALPAPIAGRCIACPEKATWIGWVHYFEAEGSTEVTTDALDLCSAHAEDHHRQHQARKLSHNGRRPFRLTLSQRP